MEKIKNLILENGVVKIVKKIPDNIVNLKNGHYYEGIDFEENIKYCVGNIDAGKSAQLVKILMQNKKKMSLGFLIFLLITGVITFIISLLIISSFFKQENNNQNTSSIQITRPEVLQNTTPVLQNTTPVLQNTTPVLQNTTPVLQNNDIVFLENNNQNPYTDFESENKRLNFEFEILKKKNEILESENIKIKDENNIFKQALLLEQEKSKKLNDLFAENELKLKNLRSNEFLINLGTKISELCEKTENIDVKRNCIDLLYNIKI